MFSCCASDVVQGLDSFVSVGLGGVHGSYVEDWPGYVEMRGGDTVEGWREVTFARQKRIVLEDASIDVESKNNPGNTALFFFFER